MIKLNTNYELFVDTMNVAYIEGNDTLLIDSEDGSVEITGVTAEQMMRLARNLFCARDSVVNYTSDSMITQRYAKEIVDHLTEYLTDKAAVPQASITIIDT